MSIVNRPVLALCAAVLAISNAWGDEAPRNPTYTKDIAPILYAHCVVCHRPGDIAPMSLTSYREVRPWAKSIAKNVGERTMPPWHADPGIGVFKNDRSLEQVHIDTILRWVKRGAKEGNPTDLPPVPTYDDGGWRLGEPDLIVQFDAVEIPAGGPDQFHDLVRKNIVSEDTWVRAVEVRPSNRKVAHHVIIWQKEGRDRQGWIGAWAAGMVPMVFPEKTGRLLKAGSGLIADIHYHPTETPETDRTEIGLHFADSEEIEKQLVNLWVQNASFEIPAGARNYGARAVYTFPQDSYILSMLPHMHYRGKDFTYTAKFPDGRKEKLLSVSKYDFNWQTGYELEEPLFVPKGTRIDCVAHWDNSADNPANPDATKTVRFGSESYDEMMIGFIDYIVKDGLRPPSGDELLAQMAEELLVEYPGAVYFTEISSEEDAQTYPGVLVVPQEGGTGQWHISLMGSMFEALVEDIVWSDNQFSAIAHVVGQIFKVSATIDPETGELEGQLAETSNDKNTAPLSGRRAGA